MAEEKQRTNPKELPLEFIGKGEVKGYKFTQLKASETAYMYKVEIPESDSIYYEVFIRKINSQFDWPVVSYPRSKSFGKWAWSFHLYEKAIEKFESLSPVKAASKTHKPSQLTFSFWDETLTKDNERWL